MRHSAAGAKKPADSLLVHHLDPDTRSGRACASRTPGPCMCGGHFDCGSAVAGQLSGVVWLTVGSNDDGIASNIRPLDVGDDRSTIFDLSINRGYASLSANFDGFHGEGVALPVDLSGCTDHGFHVVPRYHTRHDVIRFHHYVPIKRRAPARRFRVESVDTAFRHQRRCRTDEYGED